MRSTLVIKFVLFSVILNGAAVASAQATSLAYEISRISNACEDLTPQLGTALEEHAGGAPLAFGKGLGLPSVITDVYFDDAHLPNLTASFIRLGRGCNRQFFFE